MYLFLGKFLIAVYLISLAYIHYNDESLVAILQNNIDNNIKNMNIH